MMVMALLELQGSLFDRMISLMKKLNIPLDNIIGFAADGASNIMGELNSLTSRLKIELPGISTLKCICHSIHMCSSEACKKLPRHCEEVV